MGFFIRTDYIVNQKEFSQLCAYLQSCPRVAVDTEFRRINTYWPQLSLLQLSDGKDIWVVDCLRKDLNLEPFAQLLKNTNCIKILHSCRQDFEIFFKEIGVLPKTFFDTQVAAQLLYPVEEIGLSGLAKDLLGISLDKKQQNTDWMRRPLTKRQLAYAREDVAYLHNLHLLLEEALTQKGRLHWLQEEQEYLLNPTLYNPSLEWAWRKIRFGKGNPIKFPLDKFNLMVRISRWREERARLLNVNRTQVLTDSFILSLLEEGSLTKEIVTTIWVDEYLQQGGPPSGTETLESLWDALKACVDSTVHPQEMPASPLSLTPQDQVQLQKVKFFRNKIAQYYNISPLTLSNTEEIKKFLGGSRNVTFLKGWRFDIFGLHLLSKDFEGLSVEAYPEARKKQ